MNPLFTALLVGPLLWVGNWIWCLYRNYRAAKLSGLPVLLSPFAPDGMPYLLIKGPLRPLLETILPFPGIRVSIFGWEFRDRHELHDRVGPAFILATPDLNELWCADPAMAQVILARRKDFVQLPIASKIMSFLGGNILTADGEDWARQRRLVAPNLNERISEKVWSESMEQANQMVDYMLRQPGGASRDVISGLRAIAINVLGQVGYGEPKPFKPMELPRDPAAAEKSTYVEAISLCAELLVFAALIPSKFMRMSFMPKALQTLAVAVENIPGLTKEMLEQERKRIASSHSGSGSRDNLMSMLVRLSDAGKSGDKQQSGLAGEAGPHGQYLTDDEISGNLFVFTGAGFDTTANTLAYAITLLAAYPQWQEWIQEELDRVLGEQEQTESPDYNTTYPQLARCLAVMLETLRLYPPVLHVSRSIKTSQTIRTAEDKSYFIQGPCVVYINNPALHTYKSIWGEDSLEFRPSRWITKGADGAEEELITPARGTFSPWSGGPRVCPGQKMSQVEFVTVMAAIFRQCNIEPVPNKEKGETMDQAKKRMLVLTEDSMPRLTLQMNKPEEVYLRWVRR
ncbi:cytochrome P450 [Diplogelasinospora grovesii]|uniref:Cytochrome P450 n=1 Tax=Diplogelasinospora grovesii TaxID=303347 RepID=A0AAN6N3P2_9PEZI|nr:cytochrome P450 [Diplogelasinospora grovesii]